MAVSIVDAVVVKCLAYRTSFALFMGLPVSMVQVLRVWEGIWAVADDGGAAEIPRRYCKFSSVRTEDAHKKRGKEARIGSAVAVLRTFGRHF